MFENSLNDIEVAFEQLQHAADGGGWRSALTAVNHLATPHMLMVHVGALHGIDPRLPLAPSMLKTAQELSMLLTSILPKDRATYALSMAIYALAYTSIIEKDDEQRKEG